MKKNNLEDKPVSKIEISKKQARNIILIFLAFSLLTTILVYKTNLKAVQKETELVSFVVEEGQYFNEVVSELQAQGLIKSAFATKLYARISGKQNVSAGVYEVDKSWTSNQIITYLNETMPSSGITVKFNEAAWAKDIAQELEVTMGFSAKETLALWNDEAFVKKMIEKYDFLDASILKDKDDKRVLLEGYLYPDTYDFPKYFTVEEVTTFMLDNFGAKIAPLQSTIDKSDMSLNDIMTLSSIVMYEAATNEDQQMVAGVFMNRLKDGMPLQSSVTVCYVLYDFEDWQDCEAYKNQAIDSPYNTYVYKGLPIGPILNPSIKAIENTLNYKNHDYMFFIADVYEGGDGTVYYTKTYQDHLNKEKELKNR